MTKRPSKKKPAPTGAPSKLAAAATAVAAATTVLVLRTCAADMSSSRGFTWPTSGPVEAPDWRPTQECGCGLHGLLWGRGHGSLLAQGEAADHRFELVPGQADAEAAPVAVVAADQ